MDVASLAFAPLQAGGFLAGPLGRLLVVLVAIAIVIVVGRIVLRIAWRLVTIAAIVVAALLLLSFFGINLF